MRIGGMGIDASKRCGGLVLFWGCGKQREPQTHTPIQERIKSSGMSKIKYTSLSARRAMQQAAQIASSRKEEVREKKNKQQQQKK